MTIDLRSSIYIAVIVYKSYRNGFADEKNLWEESFVILNAEDELLAKKAAEKIGLKNETAFEAMNGDKIEWRFLKVESISPVDLPLKNESEIFSRFFTKKERPFIED